MNRLVKLLLILIAAILTLYLIAWFAGYDYDSGTSTTNSLPEIIRNLFHKK